MAERSEIMIDTNRLKSYLVLRGKTLKSLAKEINMPINTLSNKVNNITEFKASEIVKIQIALDIPEQDVFKIFLRKE
jgi:transcriptional regulator with XRE-family HTH domain